MWFSLNWYGLFREVPLESGVPLSPKKSWSHRGWDHFPSPLTQSLRKRKEKTISNRTSK